MNAEATAALAEIEKSLAGTFDPNPPKLHERPRVFSTLKPRLEPTDETTGQASPARNLPAILAELQATIDAVHLDLGLVAGRITRIEAFLGIEP